jgi:tetratricopeptide (TPR) repeat protein
MINKPFNHLYKGGLAAACHNIGHILVEINRPAEALEPYRKAIELRETISQLSPEDINRRCDCTGSWYRLGEALQNLGRIPEAVEAYQKCLGHQRLVYTQEPTEIKHRNFLDERYRQLFWLLLRMGRTDEAVKLARERRSLWHDDLKVAAGTAGQLAVAAVIPRNGGSLFSCVLDSDRRRNVVEAITAARNAARLLTSKAIVTTARP